MSGNSEEQFVAASQRNMKVIWGAFIGGSLSYAILGYYLVSKSQASGESPALALPFPLIFGLLALAEVVVVLVAPRYLLKESRLEAALERGPRAVLPPGIDASDPRSVSLAVLASSYQTSKIIIWALAESIPIYGLILTFITRDDTWLYPFVAVGVVLLALSPPRFAQFLEEHRTLLARAS